MYLSESSNSNLLSQTESAALLEKFPEHQPLFTTRDSDIGGECTLMMVGRCTCGGCELIYLSQRKDGCCRIIDGYGLDDATLRSLIGRSTH